MNDSDSMSSFGLLVSNIVSSFTIVYHTLFGISYIILDKNSRASSQLSGNIHDIGNNFLAVFQVSGNSGSSREVFVAFGSVTTLP
jgi:hypothetical protein